MDIINSIITSPLTALLVVPFIAAWVQRWVNSINDQREKEKNLADLQAHPYVYVGAVYERILSEDGTSVVAPRCKLIKLEEGRVTVQLEQGNFLMNWSGGEWKRLHPVYRQDSPYEGPVMAGSIAHGLEQ